MFSGNLYAVLQQELLRLEVRRRFQGKVSQRPAPPRTAPPRRAARVAARLPLHNTQAVDHWRRGGGGTAGPSSRPDPSRLPAVRLPRPLPAFDPPLLPPAGDLADGGCRQRGGALLLPGAGAWSDFLPVHHGEPGLHGGAARHGELPLPRPAHTAPHQAGPGVRQLPRHRHPALAEGRPRQLPLQRLRALLQDERNQPTAGQT